MRIAISISIVHQYINNPRPRNDGLDACSVLLKVSGCDFEMILERVEAVEDAIVKSFLGQLVPDVLYRVEFGGVRRQTQQAHVGRGSKLATGVPVGAVEHHHDVLVRVALPHLVEEQLHADRIDVGQDQRVEFAGLDIRSSVGVGVLMGEHSLAQRAHRFGRPAAAHVVDASEARLVLEHQLDRASRGPERSDFEPRTLGEHIRKRRLELGLTQRKAAQQLGTHSPIRVLNWERGKTVPPVGAIPGIIGFLGYNPFPQPTNLSERLLAIRRAMGWTIKEAAARLGVGEGTLGEWERTGRIPWKRYPGEVDTPYSPCGS